MPASSVNMAAEVYLSLVNYSTYWSRPTTPPAVADWTSIKKDIYAFMDFKPNVYDEKVLLGRYVENVTFDGYNEKIKKLNTATTLTDRRMPIQFSAMSKDALQAKQFLGRLTD